MEVCSGNRTTTYKDLVIAKGRHCGQCLFPPEVYVCGSGAVLELAVVAPAGSSSVMDADTLATLRCCLKGMRWAER